MSNLRVFFKYWLVVALWMGLIFSASSDRGSFQRSSRIIAPVIRWIWPSLPEDQVFEVVYFARKCAHFVEYAVLALLLWRALRKPQRGDKRPWSWKTAALALAIVVLYAATDEWHQSIVPSRQASAWDVLLDSSGAFAAIGVLWGYVGWRRGRRKS